MHDELSLFGDEERQEPVPAAPAEASISDWQVKLLRDLLTEHGYTTQEERQRAVEAIAGHSVESLRALTAREAMDITDRIGSPKAKPTQSAWDAREESTWIDGL